MSNNIVHIFEKQITEYILFAIILFFGLFVRLYGINNPVADWHSWRQADTASVSKVFSTEGINLLRPRYHDISTIQTGLFNPEGLRLVEFPIFNALNAFVYNNIGIFSLEVWGRLISVFSSLLTSVFLYLLGKRFSGKWMGLMAAFFYLALPFNIYYTRVILPEPFGVMLATAALWVFVKHFDTEKMISLLISAVLMASALLVKPYLIFYGVPIFYLIHVKYDLLKAYKDKNFLFRFFIYGFIVILPLLFWRYWIAKHPEGIPFYKWVFNGDGIRFKPSFWKWIFSERLGILILGVWGIIPFVFGILRNEKIKFVNAFLFAMFLYVSVIATANVKHDYYQTLIIPAIALGLASGSVLLWQGIQGFSKPVSRTILILSLITMFMTGLNKIKGYYKIDHPEIIEAGVKANEILPKDALVIAPYNGDTAFLYQTGRWGWPFRDRSLDELIEKGADYFVSVNFDEQTAEAMNRFEIIKKTDNYVIVDLHRNKNEK